MPGFNATSKEALNAAQRRRDAVALRIAGNTYEKIYEKLKFREANGELDYKLPESYDARSAWKDVRHELDVVLTETRETTEEFITLELERLDKMTSSLYPILDDDDAGIKEKLVSVDRLLKIQERRAKLLGLDMPQKYKVEDWRTEIVALIMSGQLTIEDVRKEFPEIASEIIDAIPITGITSQAEIRALKAPYYTVQSEDVSEESLTQS